MKLFTLADLHFNGKQNKPMDIFGTNWERHCERIEREWHSLVSADDVVLVPGDISWAMHFEDVIDDINLIASFPGTKIFIRGNHDYWWTSPTKMRETFPESISIIQNDSVTIGNCIIAGTRGWLLPGSNGYGQEDEKIYKRELIRLEMSLSHAKRAQEGLSDGFIVLMMHYPPLGEQGVPTGFTELIDQYGVRSVVYGHLHAQSCNSAFNGRLNGVKYDLCSADYLEFKPKLILEM